jgi:tetraacyldisaccharide 4'-kinase
MVSQFRAKLEAHLNAIWYPKSYNGWSTSKSSLNYLLLYFIKAIIYLTWPLIYIARAGHAIYSFAYSFAYSYFSSKAELNSVIKLLSNNKLIIIIGNITVGGTGKTPIVAKLAEQLGLFGYKPGIISKGYLGRNVSTQPHVIKFNDNPQEWGDEAVLLAHRLKTCPVVVCKNRLTAIEALLTQYPHTNIILADDGLQDKNLDCLSLSQNQQKLFKQTLRLAVIDANRGLGNQKLLPAGPLRESIEALSKVDQIIVHESTGSIRANANASTNHHSNTANKNKSLSIHSTIVSFTQINPNFTLIKYNPLEWIESFHGIRVRALTGIGHPERFFRNLMHLGLDIEPIAYPDHHDFAPEELMFEDIAGQTNKTPIMITEKDAIKIQEFAHKVSVPIWVANLDIMGIEPLVEKIQATMYDFSKEGMA